jgi:hypothetical protein
MFGNQTLLCQVVRFALVRRGVWSATTASFAVPRQSPGRVHLAIPDDGLRRPLVRATAHLAEKSPTRLHEEP